MHSSAAIAVLGLILASSAGATPLLSASSGEGGSGATELQPCNPTGGVFNSTGAPVASNAVCGPTAFGAGSGSAVASVGTLGAEARGQHFGFGTGIFMESAAAYSDTIVFSGPGDDPVPVRMNLHFAGTLSSTEGGLATVRLRAKINGSFVGAVLVSVTSGVPGCTIGEAFAPSIFAGFGPCGTVYDETLQGSLIAVPQDVPILTELDLEVTAGGSGNGSLATSLFSDTFGFVAGGPVFDLPAAFTANSPTSFIVDNRFLPPGAVPAVPEPSSMLLLTGGLGLLTLLRRRRV